MIKSVKNSLTQVASFNFELQVNNQNLQYFFNDLTVKVVSIYEIDVIRITTETLSHNFFKCKCC